MRVGAGRHETGQINKVAADIVDDVGDGGDGSDHLQASLLGLLALRRGGVWATGAQETQKRQKKKIEE